MSRTRVPEPNGLSGGETPLPPPHGGPLIDRILKGNKRTAALAEAKGLVRVSLSPVNASDIQMIAVGAYSPLTGFMGRSDYERVVAEMRLASGIAWPLPITLAVGDDLAGKIKTGQKIALETEGRIVALMEVAEKFRYCKREEAAQVYQTDDSQHPGVAQLYQQGDTLLAGDIWLLERPQPKLFPNLSHTPQQTRALFAQRGWRRIAGFQTRNPIHSGHEYVFKHALEMMDGLFLHPLVGPTSPGDIPAHIRVESYRIFLQNYYPDERVALGLFPAAMRYAGPREAVFHALCRRNYGCTHFIVGRDHAGVGNYYDTGAACEIFKNFVPEELGIEILPYAQTYYCERCGGVVTPKTCHPNHKRLRISGTFIREMLKRDETPPANLMRSEVSTALRKALIK